MQDVERLNRPQLDGGYGFEWDKAIALAEGAGGIRPVLLSLSLAQEALRAPVPPVVLDRARTIPMISQLVVEAKDLLEVAESHTSLRDRGPLQPTPTPSTWAAFKHYAALLKSPMEADAHILNLPQVLFFLHYPFLCIRLAGKYAAQLVSRWAPPFPQCRSRIVVRPISVIPYDGRLSASPRSSECFRVALGLARSG